MSFGDYLIVLAVAILSFIMRAIFIVSKKPIAMHKNLKIALEHIPTACVAALIVPMVWIVEGELVIQAERTMAIILAIIASYFYKSLYTVIFVGMVSLWLLKWML